MYTDRGGWVEGAHFQLTVDLRYISVTRFAVLSHELTVDLRYISVTRFAVLSHAILLFCDVAILEYLLLLWFIVVGDMSWPINQN